VKKVNERGVLGDSSGEVFGRSRCVSLSETTWFETFQILSLH